MNRQVTLIDAGTGNLRSVENALARLGVQTRRVDCGAQMRPGERLLLPGVGAIGEFMRGLRARGLEEPILAAIQRGDPLLGICVGMQALFEIGLEMGEHTGLGLMGGQVRRFDALPGLKIPHTGWNQLWFESHPPLLRGLENGCYAYFNHSYYPEPTNQQEVLARTDYGIQFASLVGRNNLHGVQFHPEKSQRVGQAILENYLCL